MKRERSELPGENRKRAKRRKVKHNLDYQEIEFKDLLIKDLDVLVWYSGDEFWTEGYYPANIESWAYQEEFGLRRLRIKVYYTGGEDLSVHPEDIYEFGCKHTLNKINMGRHVSSEYKQDPKALLDDCKNDADYDDPNFRKGIDDERVETFERNDVEEEQMELKRKEKVRSESLNFFRKENKRKKNGNTKKKKKKKKRKKKKKGLVINLSTVIIPPPPPKSNLQGQKKKKKKKKKKGNIIFLPRIQKK